MIRVRGYGYGERVRLRHLLYMIIATETRLPRCQIHELLFPSQRLRLQLTRLLQS